MSSVSRQVKILGIAFLLIFLGFNGVQQYVTVYFSQAGFFRVGFYSLVLIYLFFIFSEPAAAVFISKYGAKKSLLLSSPFYSIFIFSLLLKSVPLLYIASVLLGIAAAFLWTAQTVYLIQESPEDSYGRNSGFFTFSQSLGSALSVFALGFLINRFSFRVPFLLLSFFPIFGFFLFWKLKEANEAKEKRSFNRLKFLKRALSSKTVLKLSPFFFTSNFVFGLVIGIIPIQIERTLGVAFVGILSSLFFVLPVLASYFFGWLSDIKGRGLLIFVSYILLFLGLFFASFDRNLFLISGIFLLAINSALLRPVAMALFGDISTRQNLEFLTAVFSIFQVLGVVLALLISSQFSIKMIYLISMIVSVVSFVFVLPLLALEPREIKEEIAKEVC
ncbi:MFS transporter [bacterium]|nr:MFS transporter [bacterium]